MLTRRQSRDLSFVSGIEEYRVRMDGRLEMLRLCVAYEVASVKRELTMKLIDDITAALEATDNPLKWQALNEAYEEWLDMSRINVRRPPWAY